MTIRVMLVSPALTDDGRQARFGADAPLDDAAVRRTRAAAAALPRADLVVAGPSARCAGTAAALGLGPAGAAGPADCDWGRWHGRRLEDLAAADPQELAAWLSDPDATPHGGESLTAFGARVGAWLDGLGASGRVLAVVEPAVVRAAVVHALALPAQAFWRIDVPPLTLTELSGRAARWNLRCGQPL
ncbi:histidine phosphatase family protein [Kitasatospora sp. NBC_01560]|uniref:histidine phosphatase family protein n=1 Tax=Kitasatospora sp. NBC_01560 TaxID=2975965 RepID=UPI003863692B